jgi:hypothetical protein
MEYKLLTGTRGCSLGSDAWFITSDNINGVLPPYYDYSNPPAVVSFDSLGFSRYRLTVEGGAYLLAFVWFHTDQTRKWSGLPMLLFRLGTRDHHLMRLPA